MSTMGFRSTVYVVSSASGLRGTHANRVPPEMAVTSPSVAGVIENASFTASSATGREKFSSKLPSVGMSFWPLPTLALTVVGSVFS